MLPEGPLLRDTDPVIRELAVLELVVAALRHQKLDVLQQVGVSVDEHESAHAIELLVGVGDEHDVAIQWYAAALDRDHRHEVSDSLTLHVERAAPPDETVLERAGEGIHAPVARVGGHDVHVVDQRDRPFAAIPTQPSIQIGAPRRPEVGRVEDLRVDPFALQDALEKERCLQLVTGRVRRVDPEVVGKDLDRLVAQLVPVERAGRLLRARGHRRRGERREGNED